MQHEAFLIPGRFVLRAVAAWMVVSAITACGDDDSPAEPIDGGENARTDGGRSESNDAGSVAADADPPIDGAAVPGADAAIDAATVDDASTDDAEAADAGPPGSVGCMTGGGLAEGEHTFMLEDRMRRFIVRLPNGYTRDRAWPLVLALHGNGGSADYWDGTSGVRNIRSVLADEAVLIIAEAIDGNWRDYEMPENTWPARIESELGYFEEVLTRARAELCLDEDETFAMGFSGGGSFSGVLACRRTDIRAIAVGGSVIYFDDANCIGTSAAWITIGTGELNPGREAFRDYFRDRAMCDETTMMTEPMPCVAYDGCDAMTPVHYCQHPGGHEWPDFASEAMWAFFSRFVD